MWGGQSTCRYISLKGSGQPLCRPFKPLKQDSKPTRVHLKSSFGDSGPVGQLFSIFRAPKKKSKLSKCLPFAAHFPPSCQLSLRFAQPPSFFLSHNLIILLPLVFFLYFPLFFHSSLHRLTATTICLHVQIPSTLFPGVFIRPNIPVFLSSSSFDQAFDQVFDRSDIALGRKVTKLVVQPLGLQQLLTPETTISDFRDNPIFDRSSQDRVL